MARITVEDCIDKIPSRFELVLIASQRTRRLYSGEQTTIERENDKNTLIALREIEEETMPLEEMKENLIEEYQTTSFLDEEEEDIDNHSNKELSISEEIDKEIQELDSAEDAKLEEQYEIKEINELDDENIASDNNKIQE